MWYKNLSEDEALDVVEPTIRWMYESAEPVEVVFWQPEKGLLLVSDGCRTFRVRFIPDRPGEFVLWEVLK